MSCHAMTLLPHCRGGTRKAFPGGTSPLVIRLFPRPCPFPTPRHASLGAGVGVGVGDEEMRIAQLLEDELLPHAHAHAEPTARKSSSERGASSPTKSLVAQRKWLTRKAQRCYGADESAPAYTMEQMFVIHGINWGEHERGIKGKTEQVLDQLLSRKEELEDRTLSPVTRVADTTVNVWATPDRRQVLHFLGRELKYKKWDQGLEQQLDRLQPILRANEVLELLRSISFNVDTAWGFFRWMSSKPGYEHTDTCYNLMLSILAKTNRSGPLQDIVIAWELRKFNLSLENIFLLIGLFSTRETIHKAESVFVHLRANGYRPRVGVSKTMLLSFLRAGCPEKALRIYCYMRHEGLTLDSATCHTLVVGLAKENQVGSIWEVFKDMKQIKCSPPDLRTHVVIIDALAKANRANEAMDVFNELTALGGKPTLAVYISLLHALAKCDHTTEKCLSVLISMYDASLLPDPSLFTLIAKLLCRTGKWQSTYEILRSLSEPTRKVVSELLLLAIAKIGHVKEACMLFLRLSSSGNIFENTICEALINYACTLDPVEEAQGFLNEAKKLGYQPTTTNLNLFIEALRRKGRIFEAYTLFKEMRDSGPPPDVFTCNILIAGFGRAGKVSFACKVFHEIPSLGCMPNLVSYNSLLLAFSGMGDLGSCYEVLREIDRVGLNPDLVTYNSIINCFSWRGNSDAALRVYEEMVSKGFSPTIITFNNLLHCFARAGRTQLVLHFYQKMKVEGCSPNKSTFLIMDRFFSCNPSLDRCQLNNDIRESGMYQNLHPLLAQRPTTRTHDPLFHPLADCVNA